MRTSVLVPLIVGLGVGVFALYSLLTAFESSKRNSAAPIEYVSMVVATSEIPYAVEISDDMLGEVRVAASNPLKSALREKLAAAGRVSAMRIVAGTPLLPGMLAPEGTPPGAQHQIPKGLRSISVRVDAHTVQDLSPGDHVDVLFAAKDRRASEPRVPKPILGNVEVFSVGNRRPGMPIPGTEQSEDPKNKKAKRATPARRATGGMTAVQLLLPPDDAQLLSMAELNGDIRLLARAYGDDTPLAEADLDFLNPDAEGKEILATVTPVVAAPPQPVFNVVKVLQGGEESEAKFQTGTEPAQAPSGTKETKPSSPQASRTSAPVDAGALDRGARARRARDRQREELPDLGE